MQQITFFCQCRFWQGKLFPNRIGTTFQLHNLKIGCQGNTRIIFVGFNKNNILIFNIYQLKILNQFQRHHVHAMFFPAKQTLPFNSYSHD